MAEVRPRREAGQRESRNADRRTDDRRDEPREEGEAEHAFRMLEAGASAAVVIHEPRRRQRFSVLPVAIQRGRDRPRGHHVHREGADEVAGHASVPSRSTAAIAIPVGGHTAVALAFTKARRSPSLAAMK